jgi:hypothetical protein
MVIMQSDLDNIKTSVFDILINTAVESLILEWLTTILPCLHTEVDYSQNKQPNNLREFFSKNVLKKIASKLIYFVQGISLLACNKTQMLLFSYVNIYYIDHQLINAWDIVPESFSIYQKTLDLNIQQTSLRGLSISLYQSIFATNYLSFRAKSYG